MLARQGTRTTLDTRKGKDKQSLAPCRAPANAVDCSSVCGSCSVGGVSDGRPDHGNWIAGSAAVVFLLPLGGACFGAMLDAETALGQLLSSGAGFAACALLSFVIHKKIREFAGDAHD